MKIVIIEDEEVAGQNLAEQIRETEPDAEIVAFLTSIQESVGWLSANPSPDLMFMDINLGDGLSFSIFKKVKIECPVIFTTAYDEYALQAFDVNCIDYLLKPVTREKLQRAIGKYRNFSGTVDNNAMFEKLITAFRNGAGAYIKSFLIPVKDKLIPLAVSRIAYIRSDTHISEFHTISGECYLKDTSLDTLQQQLDPQAFFRANRQYIIARDAVEDISSWFGGKYIVNLSVKTPENIVVSRAKSSSFKDWLMMTEA